MQLPTKDDTFTSGDDDAYPVNAVLTEFYEAIAKAVSFASPSANEAQTRTTKLAANTHTHTLSLSHALSLFHFSVVLCTMQLQENAMVDFLDAFKQVQAKYPHYHGLGELRRRAISLSNMYRSVHQ